jgi:hypothetical protein
LTLKIIHFDLGTNMAFAHNGCDGVVVAERFTATGPRATRAAQTLAWMQERKREMSLAGIRFNVCHYERPFSRGFDATRCGWGLAGLIEAVWGASCVVLDSTPQAIKSFALGKAPNRGKSKMSSLKRREANAQEKFNMIAAAQSLGYYGENEHEADAYLGLKYAEKYCARSL